MAIFVDSNTRLIVQGNHRSGRASSTTRQCVSYGTNVVGGVTPGKGGQSMDSVPVFNSVREACDKTAANASMIFVPPPFAAEAILEAIDAGIALIVCITEGIPVMDMLKVKSYLAGKPSRLIGPNCPGIISPGSCKIGIMPASIHLPGGPFGVVSRSGTLTYEVVHQLTQQGFGQTTCVGIGGDPVNGTGFIDCLQAFEADPETKAVVMVGGNWRQRGRRSLLLDSSAYEQTRCRVYRRYDRSTRSPHGACGSHCQRRVGNGVRQS